MSGVTSGEEEKKKEGKKQKKIKSKKGVHFIKREIHLNIPQSVQ